MVAPIDTNTACSLLSDPTRRSLLELFRERSVWAVSDLAAELAARTRSAPRAQLDPGVVERTQIELVHNHVPRLADHGVLEWDSRSGDVVRSDHYETLEEIREMAPDDRKPTLATVSDGR